MSRINELWEDFDGRWPKSRKIENKKYEDNFLDDLINTVICEEIIEEEYKEATLE